MKNCGFILVQNFFHYESCSFAKVYCHRPYAFGHTFYLVFASMAYLVFDHSFYLVSAHNFSLAFAISLYLVLALCFYRFYFQVFKSFSSGEFPAVHLMTVEVGKGRAAGSWGRTWDNEGIAGRSKDLAFVAGHMQLSFDRPCREEGNKGEDNMVAGNADCFESKEAAAESAVGPAIVLIWADSVVDVVADSCFAIICGCCCSYYYNWRDCIIYSIMIWLSIVYKHLFVLALSRRFAQGFFIALSKSILQRPQLLSFIFLLL